MVDFGFRSATLKLAAEFRANGEEQKSEELFNTGLLYNLMAGVVVAVGISVLAPWAASILSIQDPVFPTLLRIVGLSWSVGLVFNVFTVFLESWQEFGITSAVFLGTSLLRFAWVLLLVGSGYGLIQMGWALVGASAVGWMITYGAFRRKAGGLRFAPRRASWRMLREMFSYGAFAFVAQILLRTANSMPPMLIVRMLGEASVTYFMTPTRILEYAFDAVGRISSVTLPKTAELAAQGRRSELLGMAQAVNRYGLVLFLPVIVVLALWGTEFITLWIDAEFAQKVGAFLPFVLAGYTLYAGQWNSVSLLFGLGKHRVYSWCFAGECILLGAGYFLLVPRYGLVGAAISSGALLALNRGLVPGWLLAQALDISPVPFLLRCYGPPLVAAGLNGGVLYVLKWSGYLPVGTWAQLFGVSALSALLMLALSWWICVLPAHREKVLTALAAEWEQRRRRV
jgi:O-antigen/teichoic acid export membrane protein